MNQVADQFPRDESSDPFPGSEPPSHQERVVASARKSYHVRVLADLELMADIANIDRHQIYRAQGFASTADWYATTFATGYLRGCEFVDVALALDRLPRLKEAYRDGRLSYDHLRLLAEIAEEENEQELIERAEGLTVAATFRMVAESKKLDSIDSQLARKLRFLKKSWDYDRRMLMLYGEFPEESGSILERAIDSLAKKMPEDPAFDAGPTPMGVKMADALVELVASSMSTNKGAKPLVVVHVDQDTLLDKEEGVAYLEGGPTICPETARRLACNSLVALVTTGKDGKLRALGKSKGTVSKRLATEVIHRANHRCQAPGCKKRSVYEIHHIEHREHEGQNALENLVLLCPLHHHMCHEGGWELRGTLPKIWLEHRYLAPIRGGPPHLNETEERQAEMKFEMLMERARGPDP